MHTRLPLGPVALALSLAALAATPAPPPAPAKPAYRDVLIADVPHVQQQPDFCGEACVEMYSRKLGKPELTQNLVFDVSGLDPALGRGCATAELARAVLALGFKAPDGSRHVAAKTAAAELEAAWRDLHADLERGVPSIVCMHYSDRPATTEHFRLVLGYDAARDEVVYHEPAEARGAYRHLARAKFLELWPLKYTAAEWTVIRLPLAVERLAVPPPAAGTWTNADYAQAVMAVKKVLPAGFTLVLERPFIVVGDEAPATVKRRAADTVRWATERLKAEYFAKDPAHIIGVWLFANDRSYRQQAKALFGDEPDTPYGYFSDTHQALIMNIATGGGTLVHEMVHPFIAANFPACPAWFNEGLASLYEQASATADGRICGLTNWRLAGLQRAIKDGKLPRFETLTGTTSHGFYSEDRGANYAQARYLCYYLQEKGLLRKYYQAFSANAARDPTGYATLKQILGETDMAAFQKRWQAWVLELEFP